MKYENANDVLPKDLLEQVQKIAGGRLLYIPIAGDKKLWGEKTARSAKNSHRVPAQTHCQPNIFSPPKQYETLFMKKRRCNL